MINKFHVYKELHFFWYDRKGNAKGDLIVHDKTYEEALTIAQEFGYIEPTWYKPWTWGNWILVQE